MSKGGLAVLVAASVAALAALAASPARSSSPPVNRIVLRAAQVGPGYAFKLRPDSHCLQSCVTLDMCGFTFPSELLRTSRLQVNYVHKQPSVTVSNEVVTYRRRPNGAKLALSEATYAAGHCPKGPVRSTINGVGPLTYRIATLGDRRLLAKHLALLMHVSGKVHAKPFAENVCAVYQIRGDVLSGVYAQEGPAAALKPTCLHAAEQSAANLRRWA